MEMVMTNGFCELNEQEMMMVDGGYKETWNPLVNFINALRNNSTAAKNAIIAAQKPSTGEMPSDYD